jgi:hypothetical protein
MELSKKEINPKALKLIKEEGCELEIGKWYLLHNRDTFRVVQIIDIKYDHKYDHVIFELNESSNWDCTEFESSSLYLSDLHYYQIEELTDGLEGFKKYRQESLSLIAGEIPIETYTDNSSDSINNEFALIGKSSKEMLVSMERQLEEKRKHADMVAKFVSYEMEKKKRELESIKEKMNEILVSFKEKIKKIQRVIVTIELYLGINEEIHQIKQGQPASIDEPITFRQMVLYMDEEMGVWEDGGLDFSDIEFFDEWLLKNNNFQSLVPEQKCVVVFRPRRRSKHYTDDAWTNAILNIPNLTKNYILIRNGEQLFRIFTDHISSITRLFPKKQELEKIMEELSKIEEKDYSFMSGDKNKLEDKVYYYKKQAILMQGLIDRTAVFHPIKENISILNMSKNQDAVRFVYDDEASLPSGRLTFKQWLTEINSKITEGSRVLITGHYNPRGNYFLKSNFSDRFYKRGEYNIPDLPQKGVYVVEEFSQSETRWVRKHEYERLQKLYSKEDREYDMKLIEKKDYYFRYSGIQNGVDYGSKEGFHIKLTEREKHLTISYKPEEEARKGWHEWGDRKNKLRFRIFQDDEFVMNYDQISLDDIDFYLTNRTDRPNYLTMMPLLQEIKQHLIKEMKSENDFIKLVIGRNLNKKAWTQSQLTEKIKSAIDWWKFKNKWKRPIAKDDALALRMIEKKILSNT